MKLRVEVAPEYTQQEIVIRCNERTEQIRRIERTIEHLLCSGTEMILTIGDTEYYIPKKEILFFETTDGKVAAHTAKHMYYTKYKLFELESIMPPEFVRASKSCIINTSFVSALSHNLTGASCVTFRGTEKIVYVSRAYYKYLKERIYDLRFGNE